MRLLHTMIRVTDLEKSIAFYTSVLNMQIIKKTDYPNGQFTLVFLGYGSEDSHTLIELTYNWDTHAYDLGTGFGHLAVSVSMTEMSYICSVAKDYLGKVTREPGPMKFGGKHYIAFIEDPNGYKIELIARD